MSDTATHRDDRPAPVAKPLALVGKAGGVVVDVCNDVWVALKDENAGIRLTGNPHFEGTNRFAVPGDTEDDGVTAIDVATVRSGNGDRLADTAERATLGTPTAFTDVTPDGAVLAVDAYEDDRVTFLDPATLDVVARVRTGETPHRPQFSADGRSCYVPNTDEDTVPVLDMQALRGGDDHAPIITTIDLPEGSAPSGCFRTDRRGLL